MTLPKILHFEFSLNFSGCVCNVYACSYVFFLCVSLCECSCICGGQRTTWVLYLRKVIHFLWDRASRWPRVYQFRLDQRASESQGSSWLQLPSSVIIGARTIVGTQGTLVGKEACSPQRSISEDLLYFQPASIQCCFLESMEHLLQISE